jgi:hypothetical protein
MPITQRCSNAGPLGKSIPTRSLAAALASMLATHLRGLAPARRL